jgi:hypothetical protein
LPKKPLVDIKRNNVLIQVTAQTNIKNM